MMNLFNWFKVVRFIREARKNHNEYKFIILSKDDELTIYLEAKPEAKLRVKY